MSAKILNGNTISIKIRKKIQATIDTFKKSGLRPPGLSVIKLGDNPASNIYVNNKRKACAEIGIKSFDYDLPINTSTMELVTCINKLNKNNNVDGILIQLPLPKHIETALIIDSIDPNKDVDGFHPYNNGCLMQRRPKLRSCTPAGIMHLLAETNLNLKGIKATLVGASNIVGRPMLMELLLAGCTVTACHRFTHSLETEISKAELIISAVGKTNLIKGYWIKKGAIVIDVGINRKANGKITGDVEFESAKENAAWITPVPGGVGPMTVTMLLNNVVIAYKNLMAV